MSSLTRTVLRSSALIGIIGALEHLTRFGRNIYLTRIIEPEAFGLMALASSICGFLELLAAMGIVEAVVQHPDGRKREYLSCAWWTSVVRGTVLYGVMFFAAPLLASPAFFDDPRLVLIIRIAFLRCVFDAVMSPGTWVLLKDMHYGRWAAIYNGGSLLGIATTLVLAHYLPGAIALAIGYTGEGMFRFLLSYLVAPRFAPPVFSRQHARDLFRFLKGMAGLPFLMFLFNEGSTIALGKMATKEALGIFAVALTLARAPSLLGTQLNQLFFPALAKVQDELPRLNRGVEKALTVLFTLGIPAVVFASVHSGTVLELVFGPAYVAGAPAFCLLIVTQLLVMCNLPFSSGLLALGRPDLLRRVSAIRTVLFLLLLAAFIPWLGITGAALAGVVPTLIASILFPQALGRLSGFSLATFMRLPAVGCILGVLVAIAFLTQHFTTPGLTPIVSMVVTAGLSLLLCGVVLYVFWSHFLPVFHPLLPDRVMARISPVVPS